MLCRGRNAKGDLLTKCKCKNQREVDTSRLNFRLALAVHNDENDNEVSYIEINRNSGRLSIHLGCFGGIKTSEIFVLILDHS